MSVDAVLKFDIRSNSKAENNKLAKDGYLLGNINGKGMASVAIALKRDEFKKTIKKYGRNCVLKLENQEQQGHEVMVKAVQVNPKDYEYYHVDFQKVIFTDMVRADVAIRYKGSEFLQAKKLILNRLVDTIPVSGLPQDIPHIIEFDLSNSNAGDNITIADLTFPEGIKPEAEDQQLIGSILGV
jgi:large subunit ribosomal protein L25